MSSNLSGNKNSKQQATAAADTAQREMPPSAPKPVAGCPPPDGLDDPWTIECLLKIFCLQDKDLVRRLQQTTVVIRDEIVYTDYYYDGTSWQEEEFTAGGISDFDTKTVELSEDMTCEQAADTVYHEMVHQQQKQKLSWGQMELDAYLKTEKWLLSRGLKGMTDENGNSVFRSTGRNKKEYVDEKKVKKYIEENYPVPKITKGKQPPYPVDKDAKGQTILSDGKTRPPKLGDKIGGDTPRGNVTQTLKPVDAIISKWSC